jgi:hypothetical protein
MSAQTSARSRQLSTNILTQKFRYDQSIATMCSDRPFIPFSGRPCIPFFELNRFFITATPRIFDAAVKANKLDIDLDWIDLSRARNDNLLMYVVGKYDWLLPRAMLGCWLDLLIGPDGYRRARFEDLMRHVAMCAMSTFYLEDMEHVLRETNNHCGDFGLSIECAVAMCTALRELPRDAVVVPAGWRNDFPDASSTEMLYMLMKKQKYRDNLVTQFVGLIAGRVSEHVVRRDTVMPTALIERASLIRQ